MPRPFSRPLLLLSLCAALLHAQQTATYTSSDEIIANPQRGLQKYSITNASYHTTDNYTNLNATTLAGWRTGADRVSVLFRYFLLDAYLDSAISTRYLANIRLDFARIRTAGLTCLVRFSYSNAESTAPQQPPLSRILEHIAQLAPVLEENKDIIIAHQAGFLGTWGEWYYTNSTEFGTDGTINSTQLIDNMDDRLHLLGLVTRISYVREEHLTYVEGSSYEQRYAVCSSGC